MSDAAPPADARARADALIDALNAEAPSGKVLHGALQVALIAKANDIDLDSARRTTVTRALAEYAEDRPMNDPAPPADAPEPPEELWAEWNPVWERWQLMRPGPMAERFKAAGELFLIGVHPRHRDDAALARRERDEALARVERAEAENQELRVGLINIFHAGKEALARVATLEAALRAVEWIGPSIRLGGDPVGFCPRCRGNHSEGHRPDCPLALALAGADAGGGEGGR